MESKNFSLWCDFLERDFIDNEFEKLIQNGINGITSNPAIFKAAFEKESYIDSIKKLKNKSVKEIYEFLAIQDIKLAANKLLPCFNNKNDGFVSIEIDPNLSDKISSSIEEGLRLYKEIKMPNVMIKVPATQSGFEIISSLISKGISVNATLVFSKDQAKSCIQAFKDGEKKYNKNSSNLPSPKCVISIFISRFDRLLNEKTKFKSKIGIMNGANIYNLIENENLKNLRSLFASTGVKDKTLTPDYYIKELMFENSVNTAPIDAIKFFIKDKNYIKKAPDKQVIDDFFMQIKNEKIDLDLASKELLDDGLKAFVLAFEDIMKIIKKG